MKNPKHITIIMDGNGRWAKQRNMSAWEGHAKGAEVSKNLISHAAKIGLEELTLFAFSSENWQRSYQEIEQIILLLNRYIEKFCYELAGNNIIVKFFGDFTKLNKDTIDNINNVMNITSKNTGLKLNIAFSYGGRDEIVNACKSIAQAVKNNEIDIENIDENCLRNNLYTPDMSDPDILIRTGYHRRVSNFLLYHIAYSEMFFLDILFPDMTIQDLDNVISEFTGIVRNFGKRL